MNENKKLLKLENILKIIIVILVIIDLFSLAKLDIFGANSRKAKELLVLAKNKISKLNDSYLDYDYIYYYPTSCLGDKTFDEAYVAFTYEGSFNYYFTAKKGESFYKLTAEKEISKIKASEEGNLFALNKDLSSLKQMIIDNQSCSIEHRFDGFYVASSEKCFTTDAHGIIRGFNSSKKCKQAIISIPAKIGGKKVVRVDFNSFNEMELDVFDFSNAKYLVRIKRNGNFDSDLENKIKHINIRSLKYLEYIEEYSFTQQSLDSVSLKNLPRLMDIQSEAFSNNKISNLYLKDLPMVKLLYSPFHHNKLEQIDLSAMKNLEEISYDAFSHNELSEINLAGNPKLWRIGHKSFFNNKLIGLDFSNNVALRNIEFESFSKNKIKTINFGNIDLEIIGNGAFKENQINKVDLSKNDKLNRILQNAFTFNSIKTIDIGDNTSVRCISSASVDDSAILEASNIPSYNIQPLC